MVGVALKKWILIKKPLGTRWGKVGFCCISNIEYKLQSLRRKQFHKIASIGRPGNR
jgi:hypothetical protein